MKSTIFTLLFSLFTLTACSSCNTERDEISLEVEPTTGNEKEDGNKDDEIMDYSKFPLDKGENGKAPVIRLSSGYDMPIVGLGTYSLTFGS